MNVNIALCCRFLQFLFLTLSKKKIVQEWKSELLREKSKTNEDVLISEILDGKESIEDIQLNTSGTAGEHADEDKGASQEIERQAAKIRIAKWKADKAKQEEMEKVSSQWFIMQLLITCCWFYRSRRNGPLCEKRASTTTRCGVCIVYLPVWASLTSTTFRIFLQLLPLVLPCCTHIRFTMIETPPPSPGARPA
jgi:hypothetical protein